MGRKLFLEVVSQYVSGFSVTYVVITSSLAGLTKCIKIE